MPTTNKRKPRKVSTRTADSSLQEAAPYASRAVAKAFALLGILGSSEKHLTLSQLAQSVDLTKSSTFRLLQTLHAIGQIRQDENGSYLLAVEDRSSQHAQLASALVPIAHPAMQELQRRFRETVSLAVLFANHIEVVDVLESPHIVRMANTVGRILPPHASSLGKAVTAFQTEASAQQLMKSYGVPRLTPSTLVDEAEIAREMQEIRKRGYATENEESVLDGCCFGVPIFLEQGVAVAAISLSMPKSRALFGAERDQLTAAMRAAAAEVSKRLRHAMRSAI